MTSPERCHGDTGIQELMPAPIGRLAFSSRVPRPQPKGYLGSDQKKFLISLVARGAALNASSLFSLDTHGSDATHKPYDTAKSLDNIRVAGIREIPVRDGKYKVWSKKVGSGDTKVLLLHGGPGASHEYPEAFESFLPDAGIEFYYYDHLGCNNPDRPKDPAPWTLEGYLAEVEEMRKGLGLDQFVLYGRSWGGILAIEYALRYPNT